MLFFTHQTAYRVPQRRLFFCLTVTVHLQSTQLIQAATGRTVHASSEAQQDELKTQYG